MKKLKEGDKAPDFKAKDQDGKLHKLSNEKGKWILIYFYPKDDTPGCTVEACTIRDSWPEFKKLKIKVFGVSIQDEKSHKKFVDKYDLPFTLLADPEKYIVDAYGVWSQKSMFGKKYMGTLRQSFLVDPKGNIVKIYEKVNPIGHAKDVLEDLTKLM
jgi:peroxiredoxin Q/BCP